MNRINLIYLAFTMLLATFVLSCKKDNSSTSETPLKKICAIVYTGADSVAFVYDATGNLCKTLTYHKNGELAYQQEYGYTNNNLVTKTMYYYINNYKVSEYKDSVIYSNGKVSKTIGFYANQNNQFVPYDTVNITYDFNNQLSKLTGNDYSKEFTYDALGNISVIKTTSDGTSTTTNYEYDSKINPFKGNNYKFNDEEFFSNHNRTRSYNKYGEVNYSFEYDADGYPVKMTESVIGESVTSKIYYN